MGSGIGYYVHHQGRGHLARALAIAAHQPGRFTLLGTALSGQAGKIPFLELPVDVPDAATWFDEYAGKPCNLHYAPLGNSGIRDRMAALAGWIARARPGLIVCDVSVEIAMLARLTSTPSIYVRLNGNRADPAHCEAFRSARALLAPFHAELDDLETPAWVRRKTVYCPGITAMSATQPATADGILVVNGAGGGMLDGEAIAAAARATPGFQWRVIGAVAAPVRVPENCKMLGWRRDAEEEITKAAIIVGGAGDGLVSAVIARAKPFLCLPQPRPFDEQAAKAKRLHALGAAITVAAWPRADAWPGLIERVMALEPSRLTALHDPLGAKKACDFLTSEACGTVVPCAD